MRAAFVEGIPDRVLSSASPDMELKLLFQNMFSRDDVDSAVVCRQPDHVRCAAVPDTIAVAEDARAAAPGCKGKR